VTTDLWQSALAQIKLQVSPADFATWIKGTRIVEHVNGRVVIGAPTAFAREWLENRLADLTRKTLAGLTEKPVVEVQFILAPTRAPLALKGRGAGGEGQTTPAAPGPAQAPAEAQTAEEQTEPETFTVEMVEFDPLQKGFVQVSNYALYFWQPYLGMKMPGRGTYGLPFAAWQFLKSFAFGSGVVRPSIERMAATIANANRYLLLGRPDKDRPGALQILSDESLICIVRYGEGRETAYRFRVLNSLPLLTPAQIAPFPRNLQDAHENFLESAGFDLAIWRAITALTLIRKWE